MTQVTSPGPHLLAQLALHPVPRLPQRLALPLPRGLDLAAAELERRLLLARPAGLLPRIADAGVEVAQLEAQLVQLGVPAAPW
eukprot:SAG22_NODE_2051_length_3077_cov_41.063465_6_plen_83_part_00